MKRGWGLHNIQYNFYNLKEEEEAYMYKEKCGKILVF